MRAAGHNLAAVTESDAVLVERAARGDDRAFSALYLRHASYVAGTICRIVGGGEDLDDLVQETFVTAADKLRGLREPERFRHWVVTIAVRKTRRHLARRRRARFVGWLAAQETESTTDIQDRGAADALNEALGELSLKLRVPWVLARVEEQPLADVASACEVSLATVKRRIAKAEGLLKRKLDAYNR